MYTKLDPHKNSVSQKNVRIIVRKDFVAEDVALCVWVCLCLYIEDQEKQSLCRARIRTCKGWWRWILDSQIFLKSKKCMCVHACVCMCVYFFTSTTISVSLISPFFCDVFGTISNGFHLIKFRISWGNFSNKSFTFTFDSGKYSHLCAYFHHNNEIYHFHAPLKKGGKKCLICYENFKPQFSIVLVLMQSVAFEHTTFYTGRKILLIWGLLPYKNIIACLFCARKRWRTY